ncbi:MAG: ribonuclease R [Alphaproteobacteria bacterium]|nr:ribonuclease R [Alphaproteobacteria bacterium]
MPSKQEVLDYIRESPTPVGKREIARAFQIKGDRRADLKALLREIEDEGLIDRGRKRRLAPSGALPEVAVIQVDDAYDEDGALLAKPTGPHAEITAEIVMGEAGRRSEPAKPGDRVLARLERRGAGRYEAFPIRILKSGPDKVLGAITKTGKHKGGPVWALQSVDRKQDRTYTLVRPPEHLSEGDLVLARPLPTRRGDREAEAIEVIGRADDPRAFSLIAIHKNAIPVAFPEAALAEAEAGAVPNLGAREDLRAIPLVTIDGADARDFDDAVWAESDPDPKNPGGFRLIVAIADVAEYVKADGALDKAARLRGNSVYFPDRVVPMLPERLSNDLCSLRPNENRACLAAHMTLDRHGHLVAHRFTRGLMRSAARLTYEQVQDAQDGQPDETTEPLLEPVIRPLYQAYTALLAAREKRGTLELDLPERKVTLGEDGHVATIKPRPRLDSHRLIEEFMIAANVAAAEALEAKQRGGQPPIMYRIHEPPPMDKVEALRQSLEAMGLPMAKGAVIQPRLLTGLLDQAAEAGKGQIVSDIVLRAQSQACYRSENAGHFGLALRRYCHFTSPIRRYSDLLVHRALIGACRLGEGGLSKAEIEAFDETAELISATERRAISAERDAMDRYVTAFLSDRVGAAFDGRISGVQRFGLFVTLEETGADGLAPVSTLPWDRYDHDEAHQCLVGQETRQAFTLGDRVRVKLVEANPLTGGMAFEILEGGRPAPKNAGRSSRRGGMRKGPRRPKVGGGRIRRR